MPKGNSWAKVTSNSEKFKPVALTIVELYRSEGIIQSGSWLVSQLVENSIKYISQQLLESVSGLLGLCFT